MTKHYSAAVVGCGDIGHAHAGAYVRNEATTLVAVVDPLEVARRQFQAEYGVELAFATVDEMLAAVHPDFVSVCVWHRLHAPVTLAAAAAGALAVICEKPMAISMGELDSMMAACEQSGTTLIASHQRRFTPGWERARDLVAAGAIGTVRLGSSESSAGLLNIGSHTIDGLLFAMGDPAPQWVLGAVDRHTDRFERETPIEDSCMLLAGVEGGSQLLIESDLGVAQPRGGLMLRLDGDEGTIEATEADVRLMSSAAAGWQEVLSLGRVEIVGGEPNVRLVAELVDWLDGGPEHRCSIRRCRPSVEVMMACYESARRHRVVNLPLEELGYPLELMISEGLLEPDEPGPYDIRAFLRREDADEEGYAALRAQGLGHHEIMRRLASEGRPAG
jgi:predicted dehydrogenase